MTDYGGSMHAANGPSGDDDAFERDLKEMLKDGPSLSDLSPTVQTGNNTNTASVDLGTGMPRSYQPPSSLPATAAPSAGVPRSYAATSPNNMATTDIPLSSPGSRASTSPTHGAAGKLQSPVQVKLENIRDWSISTFKCTKQMIAEKLGKGTRTVDLELEAQIEALRDTQRKYANILRLARALTSHFHNVVQSQRQLGDAFGELAQKSPELQDEFTYNAETQRVLSKNGETLLGALNFFTSCVNTLCHKTMEDTIITIKNFETARLEFDAYKADYEATKAAPPDGGQVARLHEAQRKFDAHKVKYEKLREDVSVKLKFLEENKVKVMHKQLLLFHNAVSAYFSGNQTALDSTLKQFSIKLKQPNSEQSSWLEK